MKDTIYRQDAIETVHHSIFDFFKNSENEEKFLTERDKLLLSINKAICNNIKELSSADASSDLISKQASRNIMHIIFATLSECGIYGEEATIKVTGTLKRLGRYDLLPPCAR